MLNPEQSRLVEDNMSLVTLLVRTHTPPAPWSRMDLESAGYEALCRAAMRWKIGTGVSFASYAYQRIQGAFLDEIRTLRPGTRHNPLEPNMVMHEIIEPVAPDELADIEVDDLLGRLNDRERQIVRMRMEGVTSTDIAAHFGIHLTRVSQIVAGVAQKLRPAV